MFQTRICTFGNEETARFSVENIALWAESMSPQRAVRTTGIAEDAGAKDFEAFCIWIDRNK